MGENRFLLKLRVGRNSMTLLNGSPISMDLDSVVELLTEAMGALAQCFGYAEVELSMNEGAKRIFHCERWDPTE